MSPYEPPMTDKPHCGRNLKDPWWTLVRTETKIALYEGAKDAKALRDTLTE